MLYVGILIVVATIVLLIKQFETRLVLLGSGLLMCLLSGDILKGFEAFSGRMGAGNLIEPICSAMGFAFILKLTGCDKHLINFLIKGLRPFRAVIIPGTVVVVFLVAIALQSAAGISAAVGAILIPLLISMGVSRAFAGAAVLAGTFGVMLNPSYLHFSFVANLMKDGTTATQLVMHHAPYTLAALATVCVTMWALAKILKEDTGCLDADAPEAAQEDFSIKPLYAVVPVIPLVILLVCSLPSVREAVPWTARIRISHAMLIGVMAAMLVSRVSPAKASNEFFNGMGKAYGDIMGIIIGAAVFVAGMQTIGLVAAFNDLLMSVQALAKVAISFGPFLMAVVTGSGEAAAMAFNEAVTPHAADMGLAISTMGTMAPLGGTLGRAMSPIAGACIICAGYAGVDPFAIAKRNALPTALGLIVAIFVAFA
nr:C4-dicarboxylate transporter DcuC [uncultured Cohaesibacter sp.]